MSNTKKYWIFLSYAIITSMFVASYFKTIIQEEEIERLNDKLNKRTYSQHEIEYSYGQGFIDGMTNVKYDSGINLLRNSYPIKNND